METGKIMNCFQYWRNKYTQMVVLIVLLTEICVSAEQMTMLLLRPEGHDFEAVVKGIRDDLGKEGLIHEVIVDELFDKNNIAECIRKNNPKVIVLLDNKAIRCYREYQMQLPDSVHVNPSIVCMGIMVGNAISGIKNAEAISYEIPIVTAAVNLRLISGLSISKIGVVNREFMRGLVEQNRASCKREGITIVNRNLPDRKRTMSGALKNALDDLFKKEKVDALWVPNDNILLTPYLLRTVWIPKAREYRKPVIVGIEALADPQLDFGTLAVVPDHESLGAQVASLVINARNNGWVIEPGKIEPSISVYKILNLKQAGMIFKIKENDMVGIDKVLK